MKQQKFVIRFNFMTNKLLKFKVTYVTRTVRQVPDVRNIKCRRKKLLRAVIPTENCKRVLQSVPMCLSLQ